MKLPQNQRALSDNVMFIGEERAIKYPHQTYFTQQPAERKDACANELFKESLGKMLWPNFSFRNILTGNES